MYTVSGVSVSCVWVRVHVHVHIHMCIHVHDVCMHVWCVTLVMLMYVLAARQPHMYTESTPSTTYVKFFLYFFCMFLALYVYIHVGACISAYVYIVAKMIKYCIYSLSRDSGNICPPSSTCVMCMCMYVCELHIMCTCHIVHLLSQQRQWENLPALLHVLEPLQRLGAAQVQ